MLSGKQKRFLRAMAVNEKAIFQIGKDEPTENTYRSISEALQARELVRISVLKTCEVQLNELVIDLCANTHSDLVQVIGKTIILYRPSKEHKIQLP